MVGFQFFTDKNFKRTEKNLCQLVIVLILFSLNQSGLVMRTEIFEKGTDTIMIHSVRSIQKHIFSSLNTADRTCLCERDHM